LSSVIDADDGFDFAIIHPYIHRGAAGLLIFFCHGTPPFAVISDKIKYSELSV
jgi:hypothetical protein